MGRTLSEKDRGPGSFPVDIIGLLHTFDGGPKSNFKRSVVDQQEYKGFPRPRAFPLLDQFVYIDVMRTL